MKVLKTTKSLCPECLSVINAEIYEDNGVVFIRKNCSKHGYFEDVYWSDYKLFEIANKYEYIGDGIKNPRTNNKQGCPYDCGICPSHKSHTVLAIIDVTNRCNLKCPICFANAAATGYVYEPTIDEIREMLKNLRSNQPVAPNSIQFSGGEPTVRDDLPEIISMAKELGFRHVEVNTNGIRIAKDPDYLKKLLDAGLSTLYLQFDGLTPEPYIIARGINLLDIKLKVIENARKLGLDSIVLVPTVVRGVNDNQIGSIIKFAANNSDVVRGVNFQPVSITGRINKEKLKEMRITIPDVIKLAEEQTNGEIKVNDFYPIPVVVPISKAIGILKGRRYQEFTNHQHCGMATLIISENGKIIPITRYVNVEKFMESMKKIYEYNGGIKSKLYLINALRYVSFSMIKDLLLPIFLHGDYESLGNFMRKVVLIGCMHFMDPYNFDLERIQRCTIHYAVPNGKIIPFCTMNSIHRPIIERMYSK